MGAMASQITSPTIVYSTVYSGADQRKHQSSPSQAFVRGIHRWRVNSPHKWLVTRKMFPFDDVIMLWHSQSDFPVTCKQTMSWFKILVLANACLSPTHFLGQWSSIVVQEWFSIALEKYQYFLLSKYSECSFKPQYVNLSLPSGEYTCMSEDWYIIS